MAAAEREHLQAMEVAEAEVRRRAPRQSAVVLPEGSAGAQTAKPTVTQHIPLVHARSGLSPAAARPLLMPVGCALRVAASRGAVRGRGCIGRAAGAAAGGGGRTGGPAAGGGGLTGGPAAGGARGAEGAARHRTRRTRQEAGRRPAPGGTR
eukprot:5698376-Prymnesium_polylepis.1